MILTVTPNPSIDRTITLAGPLVRGAVQRISTVVDEPGGKGVNVARALTLAKVDALALLPAADGDPLVTALQSSGVPFRRVSTDTPVRTNLAITEPDGTTTKINERGGVLGAAAQDVLAAAIVEAARGADWVVLSGSLPPGLPADWYAVTVARLAATGCRVAVDTSEGPLEALAAALSQGAPDLLKPNAEELAGLVGARAADLEAAADAGNLDPVVAAARQLVDRGVGAVLATLGAAGAVLVDGAGAWLATPPPIVPRSTVGAGDASLAGYLRAAVGGAEPPRRLRMAVAYGSAAAALPGTAVPAPSDLDLDGVAVSPISPMFTPAPAG